MQKFRHFINTLFGTHHILSPAIWLSTHPLGICILSSCRPSEFRDILGRPLHTTCVVYTLLHGGFLFRIIARALLERLQTFSSKSVDIKQNPFFSLSVQSFLSLRLPQNPKAAYQPGPELQSANGGWSRSHEAQININLLFNYFIFKVN